MDEQELNSRTKAFQSFHYSFEQAVALAQTVASGGMQRILEHKGHGDDLTKQVAGVDMQTFLAISDGETAKVDEQTASEHLGEMQQLYKAVQALADLGSKTMPHILLVYLITIFEAYLQDILIAIAKRQPTLLASKGKAQYDIPARVNSLLNNRLTAIAVEVFETRLQIPFTTLAKQAGTSADELDKAIAIRNISVHNSGLVDQKFKTRIGDSALVVGDPYPLIIDYILDIKDKFYLMVVALDVAATNIYSGIT